MKKFFLLAIAAVTFGFTSCGCNEFDEQMESCKVVMNKGKTEKTEKGPFARGKNKNEKNGVEPCTELTTRSVALYMDDDIIRHPLCDSSTTNDKPANGGGSTTTSGSSTQKSQTKPITRPLK